MNGLDLSGGWTLFITLAAVAGFEGSGTSPGDEGNGGELSGTQRLVSRI